MRDIRNGSPGRYFRFGVSSDFWARNPWSAHEQPIPFLWFGKISASVTILTVGPFAVICVHVRPRANVDEVQP